MRASVPIQVALSLAVSSAPLYGQSQIPSGLTANALAFRAEEVPTTKVNFKNATCATIPTAPDVAHGNFTFVNTIMSAAEAANVGLPIGGVTGSFGSNSKVLVVDFSRSADCSTSTPGISLVYGHTIRAVIQLQDYDAAAGISFAAIAANGTLKRKTQTISVYSKGIDHPQLGVWLASINAKDFNVENYAAFIDFLNRISGMANDVATTTRVVYLGKRDAGQYSEALAMSFGLYSLSRGKTCEEARHALPSQLADQATVIAQVYVGITGECSNTKPSQIQQLTAKQYVGSLQVRA